MQNQIQKTWFVTGASKGLGLAIVKQLLQAGQKVAATSRNLNDLTKAVGSTNLNFLPLQTNLGSDTSVQEAIAKTHETFGSLDVLINNAGYGIGGSLEEVSDQELRTSFDVNVFGTVNTIRHALPFMRTQRSGHIINIASIAGFSAATGWAPYAATKFAVVGLTEVLADDVKAFGITATVVAPGAFRTSFLTDDSLVLPKNPIADYEAIRASHAKYLTMDGNQAGDPEKAAAAMIATGFNPNPPVHLFLGTDAYKRAMAKIESLTKEIESLKEITTSTDY
ncbi:SDR family NAD(P)-dependent oxidoreductase [Flavobacterium subsaxonicum]|uniref:Short-chain dehydrogenase n=1 Tax=Flavobacterium subsaxonicum WB 4.1-42 = DSM 21790 TaxID=1121898 RepID=A0A0A2MYZ9_9FLAO|nr:SDR family NAD(P)-dependent oxidoreductase [Flavobacterium subsaxonicum]KGO93450.1 short-chain dehydrogenase [Flavobacterium subsaxonicum WB 4.1-42 = DSM 21790]